MKKKINNKQKKIKKKDKQIQEEEEMKDIEGSVENVGENEKADAQHVVITNLHNDISYVFQIWSHCSYLE